MAHNLNDKNGDVSFFTVKEVAWHGLGKVLENCPTSAEAIMLANLDFIVDKTPNFCYVDGVLKQTPSAFSTFRTDTKDILGDRLGKVYSVVQNKEAFGFFDAIVGQGEAIYETAGCLGRGETIFITAKLPSYIKVGKSDDIEKYLLLTMSHDGSGAITAMFTPTRVVCNNTLNAALNGKGHRVTVRHTRNAQENLHNAHKILGITNKLSVELSQIFNRMTQIKIDDVMLRGYIEQIFVPANRLIEIKAQKEEFTPGMIKTIDNVTEYYFNGPGQQTIGGTLWGAYNAVTGYFGNMKDYKTAEKKMKNMLLGGNDYSKMQLAYDLAVAKF